MLSANTKRNIRRIVPFGLIWLIFSFTYSLIEKGILGDISYYPSTKNPYDFYGNIIITSLSALISGLFVGTIEILYLSKVFEKRSFGKKILYKTIIYLFITITFLLLNAVISNAIKLQTGPLDESVWENVWSFLSNFAFWSVEVYIVTIIGISLFYTQVNENLGQGVLINFFMGKYHTPKEEERIFMFLDMKSSTSIAEKLGHVRYFIMLKEYYAILSEPIIRYAGEIYQYVGDEIVVSWKINTGTLDNNCLKCFFVMKETLHGQAQKFQKEFGVTPTFKAGFHVGKVTTGEIGVVKKDIIFTGDVLNTTARIQGLCNTYETDLLVSGSLIEKLKLNSEFQIKSIGESELRGKDERIELFTVLSTKS